VTDPTNSLDFRVDGVPVDLADAAFLTRDESPPGDLPYTLHLGGPGALALFDGEMLHALQRDDEWDVRGSAGDALSTIRHERARRARRGSPAGRASAFRVRRAVAILQDGRAGRGCSP
jgi:hypothetical protein